MTTASFDVSSSSTRPTRARRFPSPRRYCPRRPIVRLAWLITRFVRRDDVRVELYRERFELSLRTFRRDIAALRDAGIYVDAEHGDYRMMCFRSDGDGA